MGYQTNFDSKVKVHGTKLEVSGTTDGTPPGDLVSRSVAIRQGNSFVAGLVPANTGDWVGSLQLGQASYEHNCACTATGTEVYIPDTHANPDALLTTLTLMWVQELTVE